MYPDFYTFIPDERPKRRYLGIPTMWKSMVSRLRKVPEPQNQKFHNNTSTVSRWTVLIFHDLQCSESVYHAGGVEYVPVDVAPFPEFMQKPRIPPLEHRPELDRSKGDNYRCGLIHKSPPTLDCRYYYEEVELQVDEGDLERMRYLQRPHVDQEDDWPPDEGDQLPSEILLEGRDERKRKKPVLGRTITDGDV